MESLVKIATFNSRLEAETIGNALTQFDIFYYVKSEDLGIFGPGHSGATPQGATLWVPEESVDKVKELLSCLFTEEPEESKEEEK